jgi:hypothetical protein
MPQNLNDAQTLYEVNVPLTFALHDGDRLARLPSRPGEGQYASRYKRTGSATYKATGSVSVGHMARNVWMTGSKEA